MTGTSMDLREPLEKTVDTDFLREMIGFTAQRLMEPEVETLTGATHDSRSADRLTYRNGYRSRDWDTRAGTVELRMPKIHEGGYFPGFLEPRRMGEWPYLWFDATCVKVRQAGRMVSVAVIITVGVNDDGRREIPGMTVGASEAETFWTEFLGSRRPARCQAGNPDAHEGLNAGVAKVLHATWQRRRVHTMRNPLAHAGRQGRGVATAIIATVFAQNDAAAAKAQWRKVADQLRSKLSKLAAAMDEAEVDENGRLSAPAT